MHVQNPPTRLLAIVAVTIVVAPTLPANFLLMPTRAAVSVPSAPLDLQAVSGPGPGAIEISWKAPATDGGSPITAYKVYRIDGGGQTELLATLANGLKYVHSVDCAPYGTLQSYEVSAVNAAGESPRSNTASATSGAPPDAADHVALMGVALPWPVTGAAATWAGDAALLFGGDPNVGDEVLRYEPATNCVETVGRIPAWLQYASAAWDGTNVYVFGGDDFDLGAPTTDVVRYNPSNGQAVVDQEKQLPTARYGTSALSADGKILVFGGIAEDAFGEGPIADVYHLAANLDESVLPEARGHASSVWTGSLAYIFGGEGPNGEEDEIFQYDPVTGLAEPVFGRLPFGLKGTSAVWTGSHAYILGGEASFGAVEDIQLYDPVADEVVPLPVTLPEPIAHAGTVWDGRHVYVLGGEHWGVLDTIYRYTPVQAGDRDPPRDLAASRGPGKGEISLAWQPPADATGLTGYRVYRGPEPSLVVLRGDAGTALAFQDTGLPDGSTWCYKVTALFGATESRVSDAVCAKAPELPTAPQGVLARPDSTEVGAISLTWSAPASNGGIPVTGYTIYRAGIPLDTVTGTSFTDSGLPLWVQQTYQVAAINDVGEGPTSGTANSYPAGPPSAPRNVQTSLPQPGKLRVTWQAPLTDGGSPITSYRIYRTGPGGHEYWADTVTGSLSHTSGLLSAGAYAFRVTAVNAFGEGATTPLKSGNAVHLPGEPYLAAAPSTEFGKAHLWWDWAGDGGDSVDRVILYRGLAPNDLDEIARFDGNVKEFDDSLLVPGLTYFYQVKIENLAGVVAGRVTPLPIPLTSVCADQIDNDGDGKADWKADGTGDPDCKDAFDQNECPDGSDLDMADLDGDNVSNCIDLDDDGDRISDELEELYKTRYDPKKGDKDGDNVPDNLDVFPELAAFPVGKLLSQVDEFTYGDCDWTWGDWTDPYIPYLEVGLLGQVAISLPSPPGFTVSAHAHDPPDGKPAIEAWDLAKLAASKQPPDPLPQNVGELAFYTDDGHVAPQFYVRLALMDHDGHDPAGDTRDEIVDIGELAYRGDQVAFEATHNVLNDVDSSSGAGDGDGHCGGGVKISFNTLMDDISLKVGLYSLDKLAQDLSGMIEPGEV